MKQNRMSKKNIGVFGGLLLFMLICVVISYNRYSFLIQNHVMDDSSLIVDGATVETAEDYLTEQEALRDGPVTDIREAVSIENSTLQLLNRKSAFKTGEYIELAITLRNGYGEIRKPEDHWSCSSPESIHPQHSRFEYLRTVAAGFESGSTKEDTTCQPRREWPTQYNNVCNLTTDNGGMSWYCGKPKNSKLLCEDWTYVTTTPDNRKKFMNDVELTLLK